MCSDQRQSEHGFHDFASRWKRTVNCKQQTLFSLDIFMVRYVCRKKHTTKVYSTKSALIDKVECLCVCKDKLGSLPVSPLWIRADSGSHFMTNDPREPSVNWPVTCWRELTRDSKTTHQSLSQCEVCVYPRDREGSIDAVSTLYYAYALPLGAQWI